MARENDARLFGEIVEIHKEGKDRKIEIKLRVLRRNIERTDFIDILVMQEQYEMAEHLVIGDHIDVQGFFATWDEEQNLVCNECGGPIKDNTFRSAIIPMYIRRFPEKVDLNDHREISNRIYLLGYVSGKINALTIQTADSEFDTTRYRMNVKRKIRLPFVEQDNDRPFINSFGPQAINDSLRLQDGGLIFVNGSVQSRSIFVKHFCPNCNEMLSLEKSIMEVVPLGVEYLKGCLSWSNLNEHKSKE